MRLYTKKANNVFYIVFENSGTKAICAKGWRKAARRGLYRQPCNRFLGPGLARGRGSAVFAQRLVHGQPTIHGRLAGFGKGALQQFYLLSAQ